MRLKIRADIPALEWATIVQYYVEQGVLTPDQIADRTRLMRVVFSNVAQKMAKQCKCPPQDDVEALKVLKRFGGFTRFRTHRPDKAKLARLIERRKERKDHEG